MSQKILMDPVYSGKLHTCSSSFKCKALTEHVLERRDDVFFYWMIPSLWELTEEEAEWLPKHPNIAYIPFPYYKDRMREYLRYPDELDNIQAFNGEFWDFDIVFTSRTSMTPFTRSVMNSPRAKKLGRLFKKIICFEEMIVMDFRPTVAKSDSQAQELMTLTGYLASDIVFLQTEEEKKQMLMAARRYLSPSMLKEMRKKISLVAPMAFRECEAKGDGFRFDGSRQFNLSFVGRLESVASNLKDLYKVMTTQYATGGSDLNLLFCTVTTQTMHVPPSAADVRTASRDEFWKACREELDLTLITHHNAEFSLSMVEPVMLGVPALIIDEPWARQVFGDDYPFYVKNPTEFVAWIKKWRREYSVLYEQFYEWQRLYFAPMFQPGGRFGGDMFEETFRLIESHDAYMHGDVWQEIKGKDGVIKQVDQILKFVGDADEFVLFDVIRDLGKAGEFDILNQKIVPGDRDTRRLVFSTAWNEYRTFIKLRGWEDASTEVGHFRRIK